MNFDPAIPEDEIDFEPAASKPSDAIATFLAEASIVRTIVQGSGGPENGEITDMGLRFVRHLMATSRAIRFGFMPNLKDMNNIREVARQFIRRSGGATHALQSMYTIMQEG